MSGDGHILITGGAGYLGSVLTRSFLATGRRVVVLDNLSYGLVGLDEVLAHPGLRIVEADVRDVDAVRGAARGAEAVYHLAAIANDPSGDLDTALTRSINLDSYPGLLDATRDGGARLFVNCSSFSVYGINVMPDITEEDPLNCQREYSRCKAESEPVVRSYNSAGLATVNIRLATLCGWSPRCRFDVIVNQLAATAQAERKVTVLGGEQQRPQIHIADVCDLYHRLLAAPPSLIGGEVFNAGGENSTIRQLAETAREVVDADGGTPVELTYEPTRADERSYHVNSDKLERVLGFRARHTVREAIEGVVAAHRRGEWADPNDSRHHNIRHMAQQLAGTPVG